MKNKILSTLKSLQEQKESSKFWNITWEQGVFLSNLLDIKHSKSILEVGTSNGFSTLWLALNMGEGAHIDTIEIDRGRYDVAKKNFERADVKNITQYFGSVFDVLPRVKKKYDFIFIDAAHQFYSEILECIEKCGLAAENCTMVFDNVSTHKQLESFMQRVEQNYYREFVEIGGGFMILKSSSN